MLFVRAGPIGCKEKGPQWAVRGGQTTGAGRGHLCTWARQGLAWTAPALSLEAPRPRPATPRQRGPQPLSWYRNLVVRAPLRPPPPAAQRKHWSGVHVGTGVPLGVTEGSSRRCTVAPTGLGPNRAQTSPHQPQRCGWHDPGFSGLPCEWPWVPAW